MYKEEVKSRGSHGGKLMWAPLHKSAQHEIPLCHIKTSLRAYMSHLLRFVLLLLQVKQDSFI